MNSRWAIHPIPILLDNYAWMIIDLIQKTAIVIDPGEASPIIAYLHTQQLRLMAILITHHHQDHTGGVIELQNRLGVVPVYGNNAIFSEMTHPLVDEQTIQIESLAIHILSIPGHTLDHLAYYFKGQLFCGDTLFGAGCGRLFEGTALQLYSSLQKLAALPDPTHIYCAHEYTEKNLQFAKQIEPNNAHIMKRLKKVYLQRRLNKPTLPSTLYQEKQTNPFLRCTQPQVIAAVCRYIKDTLGLADKDTHPVKIFAQLRQWRDQY